MSKVDQDSFVDPVRTWDRYLKERMASQDSRNDRLMLSMPHEEFCGYPAPQGGFYTLSWDLAKLIGRLYETSGTPEGYWQEDCQIGRFPTDAEEPYEFIAMDGEEVFDVVGEEGVAVAREWSEKQVERGLEQLRDVKFLHQMKEEWKWLVVKELFDEDGWVPNRSSAGSNLTTARARV